MNDTPDLTHFFAIHRKMRIDTRRYARAVETATVEDRGGRLDPLARWAKGFAFELDEHHYVEDHFFFPELRERIPSAGACSTSSTPTTVSSTTCSAAGRRWPPVWPTARAPFAPAKEEAVEVATGLRDLLQRHLDVEDRDVLPLVLAALLAPPTTTRCTSRR